MHVTKLIKATDWADEMKSLLTPRVPTTLAQFLDTAMLAPLKDLLVSLDIMSLFTQVPLQPIIEALSNLFLNPTMKLFEYVLCSTYFTYNAQFNEQVGCVAMGSPLSSLKADYFYAVV